MSLNDIYISNDTNETFSKETKIKLYYLWHIVKGTVVLEMLDSVIKVQQNAMMTKSLKKKEFHCETELLNVLFYAIYQFTQKKLHNFINNKT